MKRDFFESANKVFISDLSDAICRTCNFMSTLDCHPVFAQQISYVVLSEPVMFFNARKPLKV